ncbi:MAG: cyclase family protein [Bacteroidota bacterium]
MYFDLSKYRVVDLTLSYNEKVAGYQRTSAKTLEKDGWNASTLKMYSHAGTHIDAPLHFGVNLKSIDQYTPEQFLSKAWVVDVQIQGPKAQLEVADLGKVAGLLEAGDSLILKTGWSAHLGQPKYRDELPRISTSLAHWCVDKKVRMLGVEPPSVADVNNLPEVTLIHQILLGGEVIIIEGLCNLDQLRQKQVLLIALPLKIHNGDGAPARVIALEEKT